MDGVKPWNEIAPEEKRVLISYLNAHWANPEEYVIRKFADHDIVFIGEFHRIKHDAQLIQQLIPRLYQAGVYDLGIEFGSYDCQDQIDRLITAPEYDEQLARQLTFKWSTFWGLVEYLDIYRKAWELNKSLPEGKPRFRVVCLDYTPERGVIQGRMTPELWNKFWCKGDRDEFMAGVILKEFVAKGRKALIYSGINHAFTRYHQPFYDFERKHLEGFNTTRMGNIVQQKIPDRVWTVFLHSPWDTREGTGEHNYPVGGVIDRVLSEFQDPRVGFDVKGSPFGRLTDPTTAYSFGYDSFTLETFCDGYIFQKHFEDYEGCTVDEKFVTDENFDEAVKGIFDDDTRESYKNKKAADFVAMDKRAADMKWRFRDLE